MTFNFAVIALGFAQALLVNDKKKNRSKRSWLITLLPTIFYLTGLALETFNLIN